MIDACAAVSLRWMPGRFPVVGNTSVFPYLLRAAKKESRHQRVTLREDRDSFDIQKVRDGDGEAYRRLVENHQQRVAKMMWRFSRDPVVHGELVQDVFVEAYLSLNTYRGSAPFGHWLARIATRVGYRYWKRREKERRHQTVSLEECRNLAAPPVEDSEPSRAAELVHDLLAKLPPRDRLVLTLRFFEDLNVEETAHRTGWSKAMVKVQTLRAKAKLRKLLTDLGVEVSG